MTPVYRTVYETWKAQYTPLEWDRFMADPKFQRYVTSRELGLAAERALQVSALENFRNRFADRLIESQG